MVAAVLAINASSFKSCSAPSGVRICSLDTTCGPHDSTGIVPSTPQKILMLSRLPHPRRHGPSICSGGTTRQPGSRTGQGGCHCCSRSASRLPKRRHCLCNGRSRLTKMVYLTGKRLARGRASV